MIHHVVFFELKPEVDATTLETLVRTSRSLLLKIPEVLSVRSGRNVDPASPWPLFVAFEVDSLDKLRITQDSPYHLQFMEKFIKPNTQAHFAMDFELDPSRLLKYS
jgi:hypothetical protein